MSTALSPGERLMFVGTDGKSIHIYKYKPITQSSIKFERIGQIAIPAPTWLTLHPKLPVLYASSEVETFNGQQGTGGITSFTIDTQTGNLTFLNSISSNGIIPVHAAIEPTHHSFLGVANYGAGSIATFELDTITGALGNLIHNQSFTGKGPSTTFQPKPLPHQFMFDKTGENVYVPDVGLDGIHQFTTDASGTLKDNGFVSTTVPGAGPRHMTLHPSNKYAYVVNEIGGTVESFNVDSKGGSISPTANTRPLPLLPDTIPPTYPHHSGAEIVSTSKYVVASQRGADLLVLYRVGVMGELTLSGRFSSGGIKPRNFCVDEKEDLVFVGNQNGGNVVVYRVEEGGEKLVEVGRVEGIGEGPNVVVVY